MSTTVKRGAGRPAHAERVNRHSQRTPLPPKQRTPESTPEVAAETPGALCPKEDCQRLRDHRGRHGAMTQAEKALVGDYWQESTTPVESNKIETQTQPEVQPQEEKPLATKSWGKAVAFRDEVAKLGWTATAMTAPDGADEDIVEVLAQRDEEHLYIAWKAGSLQHPVTYTIETRTIKMRNASQAKQYAARTPEVASQELGKVATNKAFKPRATEPKRSALPFDPALATNEEVITALLGKSVAWHNRYRETTETGTLGRDASRIKIHEVDGGERTLEFCCTSGGGYRAFHLSALTRVGGGRRTTARVAGGRIEIEELAEEN